MQEILPLKNYMEATNAGQGDLLAMDKGRVAHLSTASTRESEISWPGLWPPLGRGELGVTIVFLILPLALLNSSEIK